MSALHTLLNSDAINRMGWALLHSLWLGAGISALLALTLRLLRRRSSNARYITSSIALVAVPAAMVAVLVSMPPPARVSAPQTPVNKTASGAVPRSLFADPAATFVPSPVVVEASKLPEAWPARTLRAIEPAFPWAVVAWGAGVLSMAIWQLAGWTLAMRVRKRATLPSEPGVSQTVERLARAMRVSRPVAVMQSMIVNVPSLIGWLRPVILLPAGLATGLSAEQLEAILLHELAHVRRMDYLVNLLQRLVETVLFYHPAVWFISRRIRTERENCCDDATLAACVDPTVYAEALLAVTWPRAAFGHGGQRRAIVAADSEDPGSFELRAEPWALVSGGLALVLLAAMVVLPMACSVSPPKALPNVKAKPTAKEDLIRVADGQITIVAGDQCSINLGQADQVPIGMTFEVYNPNKGIPPLGDGTTVVRSTSKLVDISERKLPKGKGSIEVINVGADHTSQCRIMHEEPGQRISRGDIIANLVYSRNIKHNFVVYGYFDLANSNAIVRRNDAPVIRRLIQQWGGQVQPIVDSAHPADSVTRETDFVIVGGKEPVIPNFSAEDLRDPALAMVAEHAKSRQAAYRGVLAKAADFGVPVMSQDQFLYYTGYFEQARR